jgi:hypothetical protein
MLDRGCERQPNPLAATLALPSLIDFALSNSRSSRYRHAARHLLDCSSMSSAIEDFGRFQPHDAYEARLRREHGRKSSFWWLSCLLTRPVAWDSPWSLIIGAAVIGGSLLALGAYLWRRSS